MSAASEEEFRNQPPSKKVQLVIEKWLEKNLVQVEENENTVTKSASTIFGVVDEAESQISEKHNQFSVPEPELLQKILEKLTMDEWCKVLHRSAYHRKSDLVDSIDVEEPATEALKCFSRGRNWLAFLSKDHTQLLGCLYNTDMIQFLTTNYTGEI